MGIRRFTGNRQAARIRVQVSLSKRIPKEVSEALPVNFGTQRRSPGETFAELTRSSDPARRVQSGCRNVSGAYPSRKMGMTIQFESHRVELAAVYEMQHDPDVLEYYDQSPSFKLET